MITGPSGAGKTSFVRGLLGLWDSQFGVFPWEAVNDGNSPIFVVPQETYLPRGNLIQQICYPKDWIKCRDLHSASKMRSILKGVGLKTLEDIGSHHPTECCA